MENPLVSIVVRAKDRPKLLIEALQSLAAQRYRPLQAVVVNDGGVPLERERLQNVLGDVELCLVEHPQNSGRSAAGNTGIANSRGTWIGFLDDDDLLYPEHLQVLTGYLAQSDLRVAYTDAVMVKMVYDPDRGKVFAAEEELLFSEEFDYSRLLFDNYIPLICLLFDRNVLLQSGGFDPAFDLYEDHDLLLRLGERHPFQHIKKTTAAYRQCSGAGQIAQAASEELQARAHTRLVAKHLSRFTPERITRYRRAMAQAKDGHIRNLDRQLAERDWKIAGLQALVEQYEQIMGQKDEKIAALESLLTLREQHLNDLTGLFRQLQEQLGVLQHEIAQRPKQNKRSNQSGARLARALEVLIHGVQGLAEAVSHRRRS